MATQKQIEANRRNAQKSTGPKTEQGKAKSKFNALKHGMTAEVAVLPHEDKVSYEELRQATIESYQPANGVELMLVELVAGTTGVFSAPAVSRLLPWISTSALTSAATESARPRALTTIAESRPHSPILTMDSTTSTATRPLSSEPTFALSKLSRRPRTPVFAAIAKMASFRSRIHLACRPAAARRLLSAKLQL